MTARLFQFPNISGTQSPSESHAARNCNFRNSKSSICVLRKNTWDTSRRDENATCAEKAYSEFRSAFVCDRGSFAFTAAGTCASLSGNRNTLLQGG